MKMTEKRNIARSARVVADADQGESRRAEGARRHPTRMDLDGSSAGPERSHLVYRPIRGELEARSQHPRPRRGTTRFIAIRALPLEEAGLDHQAELMNMTRNALTSSHARFSEWTNASAPGPEVSATARSGTGRPRWPAAFHHPRCAISSELMTMARMAAARTPAWYWRRRPARGLRVLVHAGIMVRCAVEVPEHRDHAYRLRGRADCTQEDDSSRSGSMSAVTSRVVVVRPPAWPATACTSPRAYGIFPRRRSRRASSLEWAQDVGLHVAPRSPATSLGGERLVSRSGESPNHVRRRAASSIGDAEIEGFIRPEREGTSSSASGPGTTPGGRRRGRWRSGRSRPRRRGTCRSPDRRKRLTLGNTP